MVVVVVVVMMVVEVGQRRRNRKWQCHLGRDLMGWTRTSKVGFQSVVEGAYWKGEQRGRGNQSDSPRLRPSHPKGSKVVERQDAIYDNRMARIDKCVD